MMIEKDGLEYEQVGYRAGFGIDNASIGVLIYVSCSRSIADKERSRISNIADVIHDDLFNASCALTPKADEIRRKNRDEILSCFNNEPIFVEEIPNEYGGNVGYYINVPWFIVTTKVGRFKIGWRKRVISIDWSDTTVKRYSGEIFFDQDVTKEAQMIHAWGIDKAKEYIAKIISFSQS